jgi:ectoine hydroxylase-related dioxygenase (phytanoyl-CoA dioxygenase family)
MSHKTIDHDLLFAFDVQGYVHLRGTLTPDEVAEYTHWMDEAQDTNIQELNADSPDALQHHINRPVSRIIDADPRFAHFLDHAAIEPFLCEFLGSDYRHIDNDLYFTYPGFEGGAWHRGVRAHPTGHIFDKQWICPMVKVFYCLTDVGPGQGEFTVVPGSHRAQRDIDWQGRVDLPAQHIFDDVKAGDVIIFNEALIHNGRPNPSSKTRKTIIMNFGRRDAGVWEGYAPKAETLAAVTPRQHEILSNGDKVWSEPHLL